MHPHPPSKPMQNHRYKHRYSLAIAMLFASQGLLGMPKVMAQTTTGGIVIDNQATGSFVDPANPGTSIPIESNVVSVTVAEIAGITVTATGTSGSFNPGQTVYFTYTVTNEGNDPTQFFIPSAANLSGNATQASNVEITGYSIDGVSVTTLSTPVVVPNGGGQTGRNASGTAGLLKSPNANGEFQSDGYVTVRVPVLINVNANTGDIISVRLGDTPVDPTSTATPQARLQNQSYVAGTNDLYTVDNPDALAVSNEAAGVPLNGDTTNHRQEASAVSQVTITNIRQISGTVFEDPNYGGGAGRPLSTLNTSPRPSARVELYNNAGTFVTSTTTNASGQYSFIALAAGTYYVRVVNSTVSSTRSGYVSTLIPVQTFRTNASTGSAVNDINRVGGENPAVADTGAASTGAVLNTSTFTFTTGAGSATTGGQAASIAPVTVNLGAVAGVDFGFNFDTIVNTNDAGQGSLRQFIINSNALAGESSLAQSGSRISLAGSTEALPSGKESSIFMIPSAALSNGVAIISPTSLLPDITGTSTYIDSTTQTVNIGNTNPSTLGYSGAVGTGADGRTGTGDEVTLNALPAPEVQLVGQQLIVTGLNATANDFAVRGMSIYGFGSIGTIANFHSQILFRGNQGFLTELNALGVSATSTALPPVIGANGIGAMPSSAGGTQTNLTVRNNFIAHLGNSGIYITGQATGPSVPTVESISNAVIKNNVLVSNGSFSANTPDGITLEWCGSGCAVTENYIDDSLSFGIQITRNTGLAITNNTITNSGRSNTVELSGIGSWNNTLLNVTHNILANNKGAGILISRHPSTTRGTDFTQRATISANSTYNNGNLGIDLFGTADGSETADFQNGVSPYVTPNDGIKEATTARANAGMDYPIITSASLTSGTLTVQGYVGNIATGSTTFANATLEFFIAADDGNNNGKVLSTDAASVSKPHGEGKTYLGTCSADGNGLFNCSFANAGTSGLTNANNVTATASDAQGNTSEFSALPQTNNPNLLLVKRITAINGSTASNGGDNLSGYTQEDANPYDDNVVEPSLAPNPPAYPVADTDQWPNTTGKSSSSFLVGGINGGITKPGDEVEYTIYFLSSGNSAATNVKLCDRIPDKQTFVPQGYTSLPAASGGDGSSRGIAVSYNGTYASHTNLNDGDTAQYYERGVVPLPAVCGGNLNSNPTGAVVINLGQGATGTAGGSILNATTAPNTNTATYGFIRFKAKVD